MPTLQIGDAAMISASQVPKGMTEAGSFTLWFMPEWGTSKRAVHSGEVIHPVPPCGVATGWLHSSAEAQSSSSLAVSRQPFCLQIQSPHLFSPRRSLLLAPGYYTVPLGFPIPCSTLEIIPFLKLINLTVLSVSCQGLIYA